MRLLAATVSALLISVSQPALAQEQHGGLPQDAWQQGGHERGEPQPQMQQPEVTQPRTEQAEMEPPAMPEPRTEQAETQPPAMPEPRTEQAEVQPPAMPEPVAQQVEVQPPAMPEPQTTEIPQPAMPEPQSSQAEVQQPAAQHVVVDGGAQVPDVRYRLHGEAAQVDADLTGRHRDEVPDGSGRGVMQAERHRTRVPTLASK